MSFTASDAVSLTQKLVQFNTINPPGQEQACAEYLGSLLSSHGFHIQYHTFAPGRTNLIARIGDTSSTRPPLCFTGHLDTVPLGLKDWSVDPFAATIIDGKLYGRGASDMKSGVAAFVAAAIALAPDLSKGPGVVLVITVGEETGCEGAYALAKEKELLGNAGAIVVAEPTSNYPCIGHKGALWLKAVSTGVTAHGSMPDLGINAVYKAARAISKLEDFDFNIQRHAIMGQPTLNVGTVQGGLNVNSVPDHAEIGIDIRTIPGQDNTEITQHLDQYLGDDINLNATIDARSIWTDPDNNWIQSVFALMSEILDEPVSEKTATYFTDASALTPAYDNAPTIILGPGEGAQAHQTDEYCYVSRVEQAFEIYAKLASAWNQP